MSLPVPTPTSVKLKVPTAATPLLAKYLAEIEAAEAGKESKEEAKLPPLDGVEPAKLDRFDAVRKALSVIAPTDQPKIPKLLKPGGFRFKPGTTMKIHLGRVDAITAASGVINRQIQTALIASATDRAGLQALFDEIFIVAMHVHYVPYTRYTPVFGVPGVANQTPAIPIGVALLHHGAGAYSTIDDAAENSAFMLTSTDQEWRKTWRNIEDPKCGVLVDAQTSPTLPRQGWSPITNSALLLYSGFMQVVSATSPYTLSSSYVVGNIHVKFDCLVRCRS